MFFQGDSVRNVIFEKFFTFRCIWTLQSTLGTKLSVGLFSTLLYSLGSFTMQKIVGKHAGTLKNRSIGLFKPKNKVLERKISETKQ